MHAAIVGTGPTGVYTLKHLVKARAVRAVTLYEKGPVAGIGMPYSPQTANRTMLANIASIEIPPVAQTYLDWLQDQPEAKLLAYGLDPDELHDRQFTPRLLLGQYFRDGLTAIVEEARTAGIAVTLREGVEVTDVRPVTEGLMLEADGQEGPFDHVVLATGHVFPDADEATRSYFPSPWSGLIDAEIPAARVGILGTSLSAIDAAMAVATQHGRFCREGEDLVYRPASRGLQMTLMSWTGILPEADFYCPIPWQPLHVMNAATLRHAARTGRPLDAAFELFRQELSAADPAYAARIGLSRLTVDSFCAAYFADRAASDPFRFARANLKEVERNKVAKITVPWRYAILRMHEAFSTIVPLLSDADRARFDAGLKTVFVDNYAAIPSESIRRLLALRDAGVLHILALGEDYDRGTDGTQTVLTVRGHRHTFDVFIDARGQRALTSADLPFPSLQQALMDVGQDVPAVDAGFRLTGVAPYGDRLSLAALPWLMHDRPFVQGITASDEIAAAVATSLSRSAQRQPRPQRGHPAAPAGHGGPG